MSVLVLHRHQHICMCVYVCENVCVYTYVYMCTVELLWCLISRVLRVTLVAMEERATPEANFEKETIANWHLR